MRNELDILNEEILELEIKSFSNANLKTFVTYLSLCNSNMSQAVIARELEISPVTLSKTLNSAEQSTGIKNEKWLKKLIYLLNAANNPDVSKSWRFFIRQVEFYRCCQEHMESIRIISDYLLTNNSGYILSIPQFVNSISKYVLFNKQEKKRLFVFVDGEKHLGLFPTSIPREFALKNIECGTFVCNHENAYNDLIDGNYTDSYAMKEWTKSCKTVSVMLISSQSGQVESEAYLYDAENGLELPMLQGNSYQHE